MSSGGKHSNLYSLVKLNISVIILGVIAAFHVRADVTDFAHSGYWDAFGGISDGGQEVCGISSSGYNGGWFGVKWFGGDNYIVIQVSKTTWNIPPKTPVQIIMQFDHAAPWTATAAGFLTQSGINGVEFTIPISEVETFFNELRYSVSMTLVFPQGTEPPWVWNMAGTNQVVIAMVNCIKFIGKDSATGPTQPYGNTQPFSPNPTQPFGQQRPQAVPGPTTLQPPLAVPQPGKT